MTEDITRITADNSETPYSLEVDQQQTADTEVDIFPEKKEEEQEPQQPATDDLAGFYICKNWFSKQPFNVFPRQGYKPAFLKELNDDLWAEFNRDVLQYQQYHQHISFTYKLSTLAPTLWFLVMVLPDLLLYNQVIFQSGGAVCGLVLAIAFFVDTYYQRRLQRKKVHPMFSILIETYKQRFLLHGFTLHYEFEPTLWDGMNSYIVFLKAESGVSLEEVTRHDVDIRQLGFYVDEDLLGKKPYVLGIPSRIHSPRFLQGMDTATWKAFATEIEEKAKTPSDYLLRYTIAMVSLVGFFVFAVIYSVVFFSNIRHLLWITVLPLYYLVGMMKSFRRRHYLENVLSVMMTKTAREYQRSFREAGYEATFELEYVYHYLCCNSYFNFEKMDAKYEEPIMIEAPPAVVGELA